ARGERGPGDSVRSLRAQHGPVVVDVDGVLGHLPDLEGAWISGVDLRDAHVRWEDTDVAGAVFAGCSLDGEAEATLRARGANVLPPIQGIPFDPYRSRLY